MGSEIQETTPSRVCGTGPLAAFCGTLLFLAASQAAAAPFSFEAKSFEITGNLSQNSIDEFDDGIIAPWAIQDPTVSEANGVVTFQTPGALYRGRDNNVAVTQERSGIELTPGLADPFFVKDGSGDFQATSRWVPTLPGVNQSYGMTLDQEAIFPNEEEFHLTVGNPNSDLAGFFGIPQNGLGIGFSFIPGDDLSQAIVQGVQINPVDITGDILLRLAFDDTNNLVIASFSLDGGVNFQSPFNPMASSLAGDPSSTIDWELFGDFFEIRPIKAMPWLNLLLLDD